MARRKNSIFNIFRLPRVPDLGLEPDTKKSIFIVFVMALGAVSLLGLFGAAGILGVYLRNWLVLGFGWIKFLFPVALIAWGFFLYMEERYEVRGGNYLGAFLFILSISALMFLFIEPGQWRTALERGDGGGYVGLVLIDGLYKFTGMAVTWIIVLGLLITSLLLLFKADLKHIIGSEGVAGRMAWPLVYALSMIFRKRNADIGGDSDEEEKNEEEAEEEDDEDDEEEKENSEEEEEKENSEHEEESDEEEGADEGEEENEDEKEEEEAEAAPSFAKSMIKDAETDVWWKHKTGIKISLPLDVLSGQIGRPKSGDIEANKEIIRRTMENFDIPVEMGEVNVGPTVAQYTFKPAEGIKLSRIAILGNDLALALALHPIRIEAPIPNRSLVGVEVPNKARAVVGLREILESNAFKYRQCDLMIALGKDVTATERMDNLGKMPHMLVAGATNTGKSVCLNSIIVSLMFQNDPDDLRFILVDPKRVELSLYNGIPYLLTPVITGVKETINALKWCLNEMERRFEILKENQVKNIESYNEKHKVRMPYIVFIIDELADLMVASRREIEAGVIRLSQMARAVGIHLILATQRPSVDIITGVIKANMPTRIAFTVASGVDSKTILDNSGAEKLLSRGDMLFKNQEMQKPIRIQGAFISEQEIKKIIRSIKEQSGGAEYLKEITEKQNVKGMGGAGLDTSGDESDEHFDEAKKTVINMGKGSTTLLQRKLGIGYARAAKILDALEEAGVVGPANGSKPREVLISREQYAAIADVGVSGVSLHKREEVKAPEAYLPDDEDDEEKEEAGNDVEKKFDNDSKKNNEMLADRDADDEEPDEVVGEDDDEAGRLNPTAPFSKGGAGDETERLKNRKNEEENFDNGRDDDSENNFTAGISIGHHLPKQKNEEPAASKPNEKKPINNFEDKLFSR